MGLKRTVPPNEGLTVISQEEARQQIRLGPNDGSLDADVMRLVRAATEVVEETTWRALITQTWRLTLDQFPCRIVLPRPPLQSVTSLQYVDENGALQTLGSTKYLVTLDAEPGRIEPAYNEVWPTTRCQQDAVRVTYVAGYGAAASDVPQGIRQAILLILADWFRNREANITGTIIAPVPMSAAWLLAGYRVEPDETWFHLAE